MDKITFFINYISCDFSHDLWEEDAIMHAIKLGDEMSSSDWAILSETWTTYEVIVQKRIAEIAGLTSNLNEEMRQMLVEMLSSESDTVVEESQNSLRENKFQEY